MSGPAKHEDFGDAAPGDAPLDDEGVTRGARGYVIGLLLALALTAASFLVARGNIVWSPSTAVALAVLAIAQMGIHLVFFLHITTGPDNTNNVLALAFGTLIVFLVLAGSIWIMGRMNHNMAPMPDMPALMRMQR